MSRIKASDSTSYKPGSARVARQDAKTQAKATTSEAGEVAGGEKTATGQSDKGAYLKEVQAGIIKKQQENMRETAEEQKK